MHQRRHRAKARRERAREGASCLQAEQEEVGVAPDSGQGLDSGRRETSGEIRPTCRARQTRAARRIVEYRLRQLHLRQVKLAALDEVHDCPAIRDLLLGHRYWRPKHCAGDLPERMVRAFMEVDDPAEWGRELTERRAEVNQRQWPLLW